jgi:8-oxo-dGTP pyrophosphatase MutT (NUDIX family)
MKIATICFPIANNSIFLANKKRGFGSGYLNGYGGKANDGESIAEAACREFEEEANIKVSREHIVKVAIIDFFEEKKHLFECHIYFVNSWQGQLTETEEMGIPEKFEMHAIPFGRMWKSDRIWMPLICEGKKIRAKVVYKEGMEDIETFDWQPLSN